MSVRRVLGVGGPVGDDAVGLEVVRELARRGLPADVEAHEVLEPTAIVRLLEGADHVVIVDALLDEGAPGRALAVPLERLAKARPLSSHGISLGQVLELARIVAPGPRRVDVIGVSIAAPGGGPGELSPDVARAVPGAVALVLAALAA